MKIKTAVNSLIVLFGLASMSALATPIEFSDFEDFGGSCEEPANNNATQSCNDLMSHVGDDGYYPGGVDEDYLQLANDDNAHNWNFDVSFVPSAAQILEAFVTLTHRGAQESEAWFLRTRPGQDPQARRLGFLSDSTGEWKTQEFELPSVVFDDISGSSWTLLMRVKDNSGNDGSGIKLASAYLNGTYAVPEPGTLALLGLGLAGFGLSRRNKKV